MPKLRSGSDESPSRPAVIALTSVSVAVGLWLAAARVIETERVDQRCRGIDRLQIRGVVERIAPVSITGELLLG